MLCRGKTVEEIVDFCNYPYELVKRIEEEMNMPADKQTAPVTEAENDPEATATPAAEENYWRR